MLFKYSKSFEYNSQFLVIREISLSFIDFLIFFSLIVMQNSERKKTGALLIYR